MDFRKIEFGKADAIEEGSELPHLLINGYFDVHQIAEHALEKSTYLFLGYKGSGKTALSEHLRLSKSSYNLFIKNILLRDFPYKSFAKIVAGGGESESKLPAAWDWILLVYAIESLSQDQKGNIILPDEFHKALNSLRQIGILPVNNIRDFVTRSSKNSFKIQLASFFEYTYDDSFEVKEADLKFYHLIEYLKNIIKGFVSTSTHIIIIDGLDEILTQRDIQYNSLAALIDGAKNLNSYFKLNNIPVKILLLCRTDIFEKLPHPNKNKIRQDSAFNLDWFDESTAAENSNLIKLVNVRGKLIYPNIDDVFQQFLPSNYEGRSIHSDLLNYTRHTPRDFLQLLKHIQKYTVDSNVTAENITNGIKSYSINYFLPEIKDELVGYLDFTLVDNLMRLFSTLRKRDFTFIELQSQADKGKTTKNLDLEDILNTLFECSAIGNVYQSKERNLLSFKFRNRNATLSITDRIILHKGIWRALNLSDI